MMEISFYREKLSDSGHRMLNASIEESLLLISGEARRCGRADPVEGN